MQADINFRRRVENNFPHEADKIRFVVQLTKILRNAVTHQNVIRRVEQVHSLRVNIFVIVNANQNLAVTFQTGENFAELAQIKIPVLFEFRLFEMLQQIA